MNRVLWIKGSVISHDFVITDDGIIVIKIVPTSIVLSSPILIGVALWLRTGSVDLGLVLVAVLLSTLLSIGIGILKRRQYSSLGIDILSRKKGVARIVWTDIMAVQLRDGRFSIWTREKKYTALAKRSDALSAIRLVHSRTNVSVRVLSSRWNLFVGAILLVASILALAATLPLFPSLLSVLVPLMYAGIFISAGLMVYFLWKPRVQDGS